MARKLCIVMIFAAALAFAGCKAKTDSGTPKPPTPPVAQPDEPKPPAGAEPLPMATLKTSAGDIVIELLEDDAPHTVANFIELAAKGTLNGAPVSAEGDAAVMLGDDRAVKYKIKSEPSAVRGGAGVLVMKQDGAKLAGGEFRIIRKDGLPRPKGETSFGRVVKGMDVVKVLAADDRLLEITVTRKRSHEYKVYKSE